MLDAALAGYLNQQPQDFTPEGKSIIQIETWLYIADFGKDIA